MISRAQLDELRIKWIGSHDEMSANEFKGLLDTIDALLRERDAQDTFISAIRGFLNLIYVRYKNDLRPAELNALEKILAAIKQPGKETPNG